MRNEERREHYRRVAWAVALTILLTFGVILTMLVADARAFPAPAVRLVPDTVPVPLAKVQQTSTATATVFRTQTFYQNGSATYATGSTAALFPVNLTAPHTAVFPSSFVLTTNVKTGLTPRINATQGTVVLVNATTSYLLPIVPAISATQVKVKIPAAYTATGATPSVGTYPVWDNLSESIPFEYDTPAAWTANATGTYQDIYDVVAPSAFALNGTQVFVPFPTNISVNYTTVAVKVGSLNLSQFQVATGGVYLYLAALAPGGQSNYTVTFVPATSTAIVTTPVLPVTFYYTDGKGGWYLNASWLNLGPTPYAGIYVIAATLPYPINPSTLTLYAAGKLLPNTTYTVTGDRISVLPGAYTTPIGKVVAFLAHFKFLNAPASISFGDNSRFGSGFGSGFSFGNFLVVVLLAILGYAVLLFLASGRRTPGGLAALELRQNAQLNVTLLLLFIAVLALYVAFYGKG